MLIGIIMASVVISACRVGESEKQAEPERKETVQTIEQKETIHAESAEEYSFVSVNLDTKKIQIPQHHIVSIYKDIYSEKEKIDDKDMIGIICDDINNSEIVQIFIDNQELIKEERLENYVQYPILLETACEDEYVCVEMLAKNGPDYYVQLKLVVLSENLKNTDGYKLPPSDDGKRYINCFVKSEKLYNDVVHFWGQKVTFSDLQNPEEIKFFYNGLNSVHAGQGTEDAEYFSKEDADEFTRNLLEDAYEVYDDHSFGITIRISMQNKKDINIYYAEDGCPMFQLDGTVYNLKSDGAAAAIVKKYIDRSEKRISEKGN